jgi:glycosyltransferase involved in cell wall biosynthesis
MRVFAVLASSERMGGAERSVIEQAAIGAEFAQEWEVVSCGCDSGVVAELARASSVRVSCFDSIRAVVRHVTRADPDVIYVFGLRWSLIFRLVRLVNRGGRRPLLFSAQRGLDVWRRWPHNLVDRWSQRLVDRYVPNSRSASTMLVDEVGIDPERIDVIRGGVGVDWLRPPARMHRPDGDPLRIMMVGNSRPEKSYPQAIAALGGLADLEWRATIFTDDSLAIDEILQESGIAGRVNVVTGRRLRPVDYDEFDLLFHAAIAESYPRTILEAQARGLRIVASDVGDVRDIVGPDGLLFRSSDVVAAQVLIRRVIEGEPGPRHLVPVRSIYDAAREFGDLARRLAADAASGEGPTGSRSTE